jgi:hypothetical protein
MKIIVTRINCVYANLKANDPSLTVDCDIRDFDRLLGEISEEIGDDVFMEWVSKNIPNKSSEANERIKVLEDALKTSLELCIEIQSSHKASIGSLYSHYTPQLRVSTVTGQVAIISAALEVKP